MRTKAQNQNKFVRIITIPFRALGKARDLYVRSMTGCATRSRVHYGSGVAALPRSFSAVSSSPSVANGGDDYRDLIRAASVRSLGHRNELEYVMFQHQQQQQIMRESAAAMMKGTGSKSANEVAMMSKSCSVAMGRIDEDKAVEFGEDGGCSVDTSSNTNKKKNNGKVDSLFPRSKSYAVAKRNYMI